MTTNYSSMYEKIRNCISVSSDNMLLTYRIAQLATEIYYAYIAGLHSTEVVDKNSWTLHLFNMHEVSNEALYLILHISSTQPFQYSESTLDNAKKICTELVDNISENVHANSYLSRQDIEKIIWKVF